MKKSKYNVYVRLGTNEIGIMVPFQKPCSYSDFLKDIMTRLNIVSSMDTMCLLLRYGTYCHTVKDTPSLRWKHFRFEIGISVIADIYLMFINRRLADILCSCNLSLMVIEKIIKQHNVRRLDDAIKRFSEWSPLLTNNGIKKIEQAFVDEDLMPKIVGTHNLISKHEIPRHIRDMNFDEKELEHFTKNGLCMVVKSHLTMFASSFCKNTADPTTGYCRMHANQAPKVRETPVLILEYEGTRLECHLTEDGHTVKCQDNLKCTFHGRATYGDIKFHALTIFDKLKAVYDKHETPLTLIVVKYDDEVNVTSRSVLEGHKDTRIEWENFKNSVVHPIIIEPKWAESLVKYNVAIEDIRNVTKANMHTLIKFSLRRSVLCLMAIRKFRANECILGMVPRDVVMIIAKLMMDI